jgi:hypothetical protein
MKIKLSGIPIGTCYIAKNGDMKKKVADRKIASVKLSGRVNMRKVKGDPEVEPTPCSLRLFGVGLRRHPDVMVEVGDGNLLKKRDQR